MAETHEALMMEECSDECEQQELPQRRRLAPIAVVAATALAGVALFGASGHGKPLVSSLGELTLLHEDPVKEQAQFDMEHKDKDGDKLLTLEEYMDDPEEFKLKGEQFKEIKKQFDAADKDKSGKLDLDELVKMVGGGEHGHDHGHGHGHPDHGGMPGHGHGHPDHGGMPGYGHGHGHPDHGGMPGMGMPSMGHHPTEAQYLEVEPDAPHDGCHTGSLVTDEEGCKAAAAKLGYTFKNSLASTKAYHGCLVRGGMHAKEAFLNTAKATHTSDISEAWRTGSYKQVCKH